MKKIFFLFIILTSVNASANFWTQKANAPTLQLRRPAAFSIGNKGYVLGGTGPVLFSKEFWEYDPTLDVWTQKADECGDDRANPTGFAVQGKGYAKLKTNTTYQFKSDWWAYDPVTNIWTQKADFSGPLRVAPAVFSINTKGYICNGELATPPIVGDLWEYNTITNIWTAKTACPILARYSGVGFSINGLGYFVGGVDPSANIHSDLWEYNPATDSWTAKANMPIPGCEDAGAFVIGNYGYIFGGENNATGRWYNTLWQYNQTSNNWVVKDTCPVTGIAIYGRDEMATFAIGNYGYMGWGGLDGSPALNDFWQYTPDSSEMMSVNEIINYHIATAVYPNPFVDFATINFGKKLKNADIEIFDTSGKEIKNIKNINETNFRLNGADFRKGIYFYAIVENGNIIAKNKFEVQ